MRIIVAVGKEIVFVVQYVRKRVRPNAVPTYKQNLSYFTVLYAGPVDYFAFGKKVSIIS